MKNQITSALSDFFFEYETPRQVLVRNRRVGVVCRLIQLGVLVYIIGWVFIYEKGYQSTDTAVSSVFTKMKGVGYTNVSGSETVWDVADYVFPSQGDSSFVVMTNFIITEGQKMGKCPELAGKHNCTSDADCVGGSFKRQTTGVCVNKTQTCEVLAWCPVEDDRTIPNPPLLMSAENYTLFIKNSVTFPLFGVTRSNLVEGIDGNYIGDCLFDPKEKPLCPIFKLGDIVKLSGFSFEKLAQEGGAIGIVVDWTCNFDVDVKHCKPEYNFHGLYGNPSETDGARASVGYNFRYAKYYMEDKIPKRTLLKVFGIRFDVIVKSLARKFDIIPTLTAIGSGVGIFGVATVVCDLVLLYLLPKREFYKNMKFKYTDTQTQTILSSARFVMFEVQEESQDSESIDLDSNAYKTLEANSRRAQDKDEPNVSASRILIQRQDPQRLRYLKSDLGTKRATRKLLHKVNCTETTSWETEDNSRTPTMDGPLRKERTSFLSDPQQHLQPGTSSHSKSQHD
ncbi:P2X purinoceptor 1 isoform X5 [Poecilia formosa]|uniref:P2X purinoceptor 1 isoform X5 n=1 Tax=Poecilia formosa TaxID=48698 RepID=UPI0007B8C1D5|nr:PREDICTED: P2X purinoceptor 1 isoform X5 [Poecilia formosa]